MMSSNIDITEVVFEGSWINAIIGIIFYCNNDFSGGWLRSVNNDFAFTLSNVAILNIYVNLSIFVALVCYISANNGTINLGSSPLAFDGALRESPPPAWRKMRTKKRSEHGGSDLLQAGSFCNDCAHVHASDKLVTFVEINGIY